MFYHIDNLLMYKIKIIIFLVILLLLLSIFNEGRADDLWFEKQSDHFIVKYLNSDDLDFIKQVLLKAESDYTKIADSIGYARYSNYWSWQDKVVIYIYEDSQHYTKSTGQPWWSSAGAVRDLKLFDSRAIVTYKQEVGFTDEILAHEIAHLIMRDFIGFDVNIPVWFDEGVAQLQEKDKAKQAKEFMKNMLSFDQYIPFNIFLRQDIRDQSEPFIVALFYAQSVSVVDFLITKYGSFKFSQLCLDLKNKKSFEMALKSIYPLAFGSLDDFQGKWIGFVKN